MRFFLFLLVLSTPIFAFDPWDHRTHDYSPNEKQKQEDDFDQKCREEHDRAREGREHGRL